MELKKKRNLWIAGGIVAFALAILIGLHMYYSTRWYPGTKIEKISVSGMTYKASMDKIKKEMSSYQLKIKARSKGILVVGGDEIDLRVENQEAVEEMYRKQHKTSIVFSAFTKKYRKISNVLSYSKDKLLKIVTKSYLIKGSKSYPLVKPVDATIVYSTSKKYGVIQKEVLGNIINKDQFMLLLEDRIETLSTSVDITKTKLYPKIYKAPRLYADEEDTKTMLKEYNQYILHWLKWDMGSNLTETIGPDLLQTYVKVNTKKRTVTLSTSKLETMVEEFCLKYKTVGITRKFKTHTGKKIKVAGGDYGWQIDYDDALKKTLNVFHQTANENAIAAYQKKATLKNQEALTTELKVKYKNKGYTYDINNKQNDWNTKNYSEVDLSEQRVYVYKKGKLAFSCICITGKPTSDRLTRTGVWYVKEKRYEKTLVGADYSVETKYWVRIMWTGTGYHYSSRGDWGSWSPSYYKSAGSHGCVNLTYSNAQTIYDLVNSGDPVFIHY